jgi:predicted TIM-barrel fold metal-dependent hydrolase
VIIDTHMHIWRYPDHFNKKAMLDNQPERRRSWSDEKFHAMWDNPVERYFEEAKGVIDKAILMTLKSSETFGITVPNEYMADLKKQYPDKLEWACNMDPTKPEAIDELEHCVKDLGAIAVGEISPAYQGFYFNDERAYPFYEKAQKLGIPIVVHAGPAQPKNLRMKYADVLRIDDVAIDFPVLKLVICHMGYYKYDDAIHLVQKHDNVFMDCSWLTQLAGVDRNYTPRYLPVVMNPYFNLFYPLMRYWSETWGSTDKLLWGSDWTGTHPKTSIDILLSLNNYLKQYGYPEVPQKVLDDIVYENWKKVYPGLALEA